MLPDFKVLSGALNPNSFYSRHLSLNDIRAQIEDEKSDDLSHRRTSSLPLCNEKEPRTIANFQSTRNNRNLKAAKKPVHKEYKDEGKVKSPSMLNSKEKSRLGGHRASDVDLNNTSDVRAGIMDKKESAKDVYETADGDGNKWCQCSSKQYIKGCSQSTRRRSPRAKILKRNMMDTLVEECPTETKCGRCFLEIRDESKRKERIIELWMQFFG